MGIFDRISLKRKGKHYEVYYIRLTDLGIKVAKKKIIVNDSDLLRLYKFIRRNIGKKGYADVRDVLKDITKYLGWHKKYCKDYEVLVNALMGGSFRKYYMKYYYFPLLVLRYLGYVKETRGKIWVLKEYKVRA